MLRRLSPALQLFVALMAAMAAGGCSSDINFRRIPYARVYVAFTTEGDWNVYGAPAAMDSRRFIREDRVPADYPYSELSFTGYGGVLLTCDVYGVNHVFDLACPVERQPQVRVVVDLDAALARCPKCGSTYDVFNVNGGEGGSPMGGMAAEERYGLTRYNMVYRADGRYALLTH